MSQDQDKSVSKSRREKAAEVRIGEFGIAKARYLDMRAAALQKMLPKTTDLSLQERLLFAWLVLIFDYEDNEIEALIGRSVKQYWRYVEGQDVPLSVLLRICEVTGIPESYLVLGTANEVDKIVNIEGGRSSTDPLDDELFGRIVDAVARLYAAEHVALAPIDLGRIAARKYDEIIAATADPIERSAMIKLVVTQLRAELRSARAEPGTGKASA